MEGEKADELKYWAFISYSHSDKEWGDWLHRGLETYRVPRRLVGRTSRDGTVPKRAFPVFRDREELPGSANLGDNINAGLAASRYLIVICSPRSAVSRWVNEEIKTFKVIGREDRILCLIVEGEPNASAKPELGLLECFPEAVRFRVDANRQITDEQVEPIAADARKGKDGKYNAKLKLLAGVLGVAYDELRQRDKQRQQRRRIQIVAASIVLVGIVAATFTWKERQRRLEQQRAIAQSEFAIAIKLLEQSQAPQAVGWLARAVRDDPANETARTRLLSLLTQRNWVTPAGAALTHKGAVLAAEFSPDGQRVVTASDDGSVRLWDARSGAPITDAIAHNGANSVAFSPDGTRFLSGGAPDARIFDTTTGKQIGPALKHAAAVEIARFSHDGSAILTASVDGTARIWNAANGELRATLPHASVVLFAAWSSDGARIATASLDETARVWDAATGLPTTAPIKLKSMPFGLEFSPNGSRFITISQFVAQLWDSTTGQSVLTLEHKGAVASAHFSPDGKSILTGSFDKTAQVCDAATGAAIGAPLQHSEAVHLAVFSPDAQRILTTTREGTAQLWDAKSGSAMAEPFHHADDIAVAAFDPSGTRVLTASKDHVAQVWDVSSSAMSPLVLTAPDRLTAINFEHAGSHFQTLANDGTAQTWDAASGKLIATRKQPDGTPPIVSADGKRRAIIDPSRMSVSVRDAATNQAIGAAIAQKLPAMTAALDANGSRVAIAGVDNTVTCYDVATGQRCFEPIKHPELVRHVAFSADGTRLATASMDRMARVWDARDGRSVSEPLPHNAVVEHVQFSRDGRRLATASWDHKARVWDLATRQLLFEPFEHEEEAVRDISFSTDERHVATAAGNRAFIWELTIPRLKTPGWFADLAEAICGWRVAGNGLLAHAADRAATLQRARENVQKRDDDLSRSVPWLLANRESRTISPFATATVPPHSTPPPPGIEPASNTPASPAAEAPEHMLLAAWLQHAQFALSQMKAPNFASRSAEQAVRLANKFADAQPATFDAQQELNQSTMLLAQAQLGANEPAKALGAVREAMAAADRMAQLRPNDSRARNEQANAWEAAAYCHLFNRQPREAIDAARKGLQLDPGQPWLKIDLATALLFNGQFAEAEPIYRANKDIEIPDAEQKTFGRAAVKLLDELKARKIEHADVERARTILAPQP